MNLFGKKDPEPDEDGLIFDNFMCRSGTTLGYGHKNVNKNNQDAVKVWPFVVEREPYLCGVVTDGCTADIVLKDSEGLVSKTEVGSALTAEFLCSEIETTLKAGADIKDIPQLLYPRYIGYLRSLATQTVVGDTRKVTIFILQYLLCTVNGFVMNSKHCIHFMAGDGMVVCNDKKRIVDQNDKPSYPAYELLLERSLTRGKINIAPGAFTVSKLQTNGIKRFAVTTDGFVRTMLTQPELLDQVFTHRTDAPAGLQWLLNKNKFKDDATVIELHRT